MPEDRKARLAALKARAGRGANTQQQSQQAEQATSIAQQEDDAQKEPMNTDENDAKNIKFRNYAPKDKLLDAGAATGAGDDNRDDEKGPSSKRMKTSNSSQQQEEDESNKTKSTQSELEKALLQAKAEAKRNIQNQSSIATASTDSSTPMDTTDMTIAAAPKKINWDLKRDISKKLQRLERRTQKAVVELLKERLEREAMEDDDDLD